MTARRWSEADVEHLRQLAAQPYTYQQIAEAFPGRSFNSVRMKLLGLGLARDSREHPAQMPLLEPQADAPALRDDDLIRLAEERGYVIHKPMPPTEPIELDLSRVRGNRVKLGIISDPHFGSKYQQPTYLREHARLMKREGCTAILMPGDVTDGSPSMHPGFVYETWAQGFDAQKAAAIEYIPDLGIPWWLMGGNHDASHYKAAGADIVKAICEARDDLHYVGPEQSSANFAGSVAWFNIGEVRLQMCHPHLGSTRTRSYRLETWIENLQPPRPQIVCMGNFHKVVQGIFRGVWGLMVPSYQSQSAWMASKSIESMVGGAIIEFGTVTKGLAPELSIRWLMEWEPRANDWPGAR
jgi:predicted phosphodiesterase